MTALFVIGRGGVDARGTEREPERNTAAVAVGYGTPSDELLRLYEVRSSVIDNASGIGERPADESQRVLQEGGSSGDGEGLGPDGVGVQGDMELDAAGEPALEDSSGQTRVLLPDRYSLPEVSATPSEGLTDVPRPPPPGPDPVVSPADIPALVCSYEWPCGQALAVFACESHLDPSAVSPDGENIGIAQIGWRWHLAAVAYEPSRLFDAATNIRVAFGIWQAAGGSWRDWSCRP